MTLPHVADYLITMLPGNLVRMPYRRAPVYLEFMNSDGQLEYSLTLSRLARGVWRYTMCRYGVTPAFSRITSSPTSFSTALIDGLCEIAVTRDLDCL